MPVLRPLWLAAVVGTAVSCTALLWLVVQAASPRVEECLVVVDFVVESVLLVAAAAVAVVDEGKAEDVVDKRVEDGVVEGTVVVAAADSADVVTRKSE